MSFENLVATDMWTTESQNSLQINSLNDHRRCYVIWIVSPETFTYI